VAISKNELSGFLDAVAWLLRSTYKRSHPKVLHSSHTLSCAACPWQERFLRHALSKMVARSMLHLRDGLEAPYANTGY
jgi:hypothetical protein